MSITRSPRLLLALLLALSPAAFAQTSASSALINQQLDQQTKLQLSGTLPKAMADIAKQTGVPIEAQQAVWDMLPWGKETSVTATIENQTLRQALHAITTRLGLTFVLKEEAIELQPMPALVRLGRKSTLAELEALNVLTATKLELKNAKPKLKDLIEAIDLKLESIKSPYAIENRSATGGAVAQELVLSIPANATMAEALEAMERQSTATWYPWGRTIVVIAKQDQVRRMLDKEIAVRHEGTDVAQVLTDLSTRSGVPFRYEPGAVQAITPQARTIRLLLNAKVIDALEAVCSVTGLGYVVKEDQVWIWNAQAQAAAPRERAIGILRTEAGIDLLITESQVPADVREFWEFQKKKSWENMRKMMAEQGFKPTAPATDAPAKPVTPAPPVKAGEKVGESAPGKDL